MGLEVHAHTLDGNTCYQAEGGPQPEISVQDVITVEVVHPAPIWTLSKLYHSWEQFRCAGSHKLQLYRTFQCEKPKNVVDNHER
jgi:hypothetical protein